MGRKSSVQIQSPNLPSKTDRAGPSYKVQLNKIVDQKTEPELYNVLAKQPGEHAHHIAILETLAPLFDNLNEAGQRVLRNYINQEQAIGNHIRNLINIPGELHQGGIHEYAVSELPEEDWFCDKMYYPDRFGHPHSNANKAFTKNILLKRIKELYL